MRLRPVRRGESASAAAADDAMGFPDGAAAVAEAVVEGGGFEGAAEVVATAAGLASASDMTSSSFFSSVTSKSGDRLIMRLGWDAAVTAAAAGFCAIVGGAMDDGAGGALSIVV